MPVDIQEFFKFGMDRDIPPLRQGPKGMPTLEFGPGSEKKGIVTDYKLDLPEWDAGVDEIPLPGNLNDKWGQIMWGEMHAYHFMEHLDGESAIFFLRNVQQSLHPLGVLNLVIPYYNSSMQHQALDHKSTWNEGTWPWLFGDQYNDEHTKEWRLKVHCCFIMGIVERNLALFTQLVLQ